MSSPAPQDPISFDGLCTVCGTAGRFTQSGQPGRVARDFRCPGCGSALLFQAEAATLLDEYSDGRDTNLEAMLRSGSVDHLRVYNIGINGPIRSRLRHLRHYCESVYVPDEPLGSPYSRDATVQDHTALTFEDRSFDLLLSSHVLEHVPDVPAAFAEAFRVLRPAGRYIFTVPPKWPFPPTSVARATMGADGPIHHLPEQYHRAPERTPALVFTDFGADLRAMLQRAGFAATIRRPHRSIDAAYRNYVVVATRPPAA